MPTRTTSVQTDTRVMDLAQLGMEKCEENPDLDFIFTHKITATDDQVVAEVQMSLEHTEEEKGKE